MRSSTGFDHLTYYFGNQKMASTGYYKPTINHTTSCCVMPAWMKVFSVLKLICDQLSLLSLSRGTWYRGGVIVVASILGPWRLLPSNPPRGAFNVRMDTNFYKYRGRRHGVEGRSLEDAPGYNSGCWGPRDREKKGAKRPPARHSGLPPSLALMVLCTFYHAGVRNVTLVSQTFILRERKTYLKKREFGGGGGVK
jgi:hypothetical protein